MNKYDSENIVSHTVRKFIIATHLDIKDYVNHYIYDTVSKNIKDKNMSSFFICFNAIGYLSKNSKLEVTDNHV